MSRYTKPLDSYKITAPAGPKKAMGASGKTPTASMGGEKTANWKNAGAAWGSSFNRATKVSVVKTRAAKAGID